jgi:2-methylisocitrate lyase-like PEP mutase family enzyme
MAESCWLGAHCSRDADLMTTAARQFKDLHTSGTFVMPNPFDVGSTRLLTALGFSALATTSAGFAATLGRLDMNITRDELIAHVQQLTAATPLPMNVDSERCFAGDPAGVAQTVRLLAEAGAAGCSIEDWNPATDAIDSIDEATARVAAAAAAADEAGIVLTARCENHLHGVSDLDDTIARLQAYSQAGAHAVYAPGLVDLAQIGRVVQQAGAPVNVLLLPGGPSVAQLAEVGVRRVSLGSGLSTAAYGAVVAAARSVLTSGSMPTDGPRIERSLAAAAFATG